MGLCPSKVGIGLGRKCSEEAKQKMRHAKLGKFRDGMSGKWVDTKPVKPIEVTDTAKRDAYLASIRSKQLNQSSQLEPI